MNATKPKSVAGDATSSSDVRSVRCETRSIPLTRTLSFTLAWLLAWIAIGDERSVADGPQLFSDSDAPAAAIDFARDILPILSDNCFACHGPDETHREAELRLDQPGSHAIVAGDPAASELLSRLLSDDPDTVMPPPDSGKTLSRESIEAFHRWIAQGAEYSTHWAFVPPVRPTPPTVSDASVRGPIDIWILDRLKQQNLRPSGSAAPAALLRRLHLDLVGLPPTPDEVRRFIADPSPVAYEREVDRLLASPEFGERWGRVWLDAARYADSDGFEKDKPRFVWFYRDWVIDALNSDLPYDRFITKQLAGDLLPDATQADHVATGFLRNSMINEEGGVDPEQFRMEAMFDRVDAIGKSILGLTLQCAQCHSHKYDPLSHDDYFGLLAFINNCHEASVTVYTPEQQVRRSATLQRIRDRIEAGLDADWQTRFRRWEADALAEDATEWTPLKIDFIAETIGGQKFLPQPDGSYIAAGYAPTKFHPTGELMVEGVDRITALRLEMLTDPNLPHGGPGRSVDGTWALSQIELLTRATNETGDESWLQAAWDNAAATIDLPPSVLGDRYHDKSDRQRMLGPVGFAIDGNYDTAWHGDRGPGRRNVSHTAVFRLAEPIATAPSANESNDRSDAAAAVRLRLKLVQNHGGWNSDDNQTHNLGRFRVSVTSDPQPTIAAVPPVVQETLRIPADRRDEQQWLLVMDEFIRQDESLSGLVAEVERLWAEHPAGTSQLTLAERTTPRVTHRLERGDFLSPREPVTPAVPTWLSPAGLSPAESRLPDGRRADRLDLARWLLHPDHPTTARSIVNRLWQAYFGTGLVATSDDLGLQGEPPTHPELLDHLAVELVENGWSLKAIHRRIVLSAAYRQDSAASGERRDRDPQNRLISRGPRGRLPAETVRDLALAAGGLLNRNVGGPPVYPPAPDFLFNPPASYGPKTWSTSSGSDRYRRALYTFRFRSVPYPVLEAFDAPNADVSCVRRNVSNTPLQALVTLNEPMFLRCAQELARQAVERPDSASSDPIETLDFVFLACTSRQPTAPERQVLRELLSDQRTRFSQDIDVAAELIAGIADRDESESRLAELAAWTMVCRVVMNLDEAISKP